MRRIAPAMFGLLLAGLLGPAAWAQRAPQDPHIGYAYPAGGKVGTTFEIVVGGQFLRDVSEAYVSGKGVKVSIQRYFKHLTQGENNALNRRRERIRDKLEEEAQKKGEKPRRYTFDELTKLANYTPMEMEQMADYRLRAGERKRQPNAQLMEDVTLRVSIAANAPPGERELRLIAPSGMSNPVYFQVGTMAEFRENEPNDVRPDYSVGDTLPAAINGQIMPGDVDRFSFRAKKGMKVVIFGAARELIPYLADAVPGWFQAVLTLSDAKGNELAYAGAFGYRQDPVIYFEVPQDGEYTVEIRDSIYRGREDFVYRITLGEFPYITGLYPLGGRAGTQLNVSLTGWNLPTDQLKIDAYYDRGAPIRLIGIRQQERFISNRMPFAVDMVNEVADAEPNNQAGQAQVVTTPVVINGRIDKPGDVDVFQFEGKAKETIVAEVYARRLGSPMDSLVKILDADGKILAANDDYKDEGLALVTHHADSRAMVQLQTSGTYYVRLSDAQTKGGPEYAYRLQIRPPRPDFDLRVVPSSVIARAGTNVAITVYALRRDGFNEDIALDLVKPPPGFRINGGWVPGGQDKVRLTLTAPTSPTPEPLSLDMEGHANTRQRRLMHYAVPAEAMMQAFAYNHLVPAKDWTVMVTGKPNAKPQTPTFKDEKIKLLTKGTNVRVLAAPGAPKNAGTLQFDLSEPPEGITIEKVTPDGDGAVILLKADGDKAKAGLKGNLLFHAFLERTVTNAEKKTSTQRSPLGMMPALAFEVMGK